MEKPEMTATEWIQEWIREFPYDEFLVKRLREEHGESDEDIKDFLEGL